MAIRPKYWTHRPLSCTLLNPPAALLRLPRMSTTMDNADQLQALCAELGVSPAVSSCLGARGLLTPSDLAYSIPDTASLEVLILMVLRDDEAP